MSAGHALTKELILARCKTDNLKLLKNLNLWGVGFEDVSLLNQMPNIEVLSLSINKISSLKDFQHCSKLQELYIRRNNIKNLAELKYLTRLPNLRILWLSENPCADHPNYRSYVISQLPGLQKLDNKDVTGDERANADLNLEEPEEKFYQ
jgi:Leucine-rich repeat (LRR) protein